jgi:hypothetical protein
MANKTSKERAKVAKRAAAKRVAEEAAKASKAAPKSQPPQGHKVDPRMKNVRLRQFEKLAYGDPRGFLAALRKVEWAVAASSSPERIKTLRTQRLRPEREMRDAAIFCVGLSERIGSEVRFSPYEDQDFDFVATWFDGDGVTTYKPVQLKEVTPHRLNAGATIQAVVDGLTRYADSADVIVAIKINRLGRFDPAELKLPANLRIGQLWIFASLSADQSEFGLWGDFLSKTDAPLGTRFSYPLLEEARGRVQP